MLNKVPGVQIDLLHFSRVKLHVIRDVGMGKDNSIEAILDLLISVFSESLLYLRILPLLLL